MQAVRASRFILACRGTVNEVAHNQAMRKGDIICPECRAGLRRIELSSRKGHAGEFRCPLCDCVLEVSDGSTEIAYRLTVAPEKLFD
jgi:transposase-like protein